MDLVRTSSSCRRVAALLDDITPSTRRLYKLDLTSHHPIPPYLKSSDISSAPEIITLLTDEIQAEGEYLSFRINLIDMDEDSADIDRGAEGKENVLAQGSVALWVMIEDSCSILRQVTRTAAFTATFYQN